MVDAHDTLTRLAWPNGRPGRKRVGLALSGGAARGAAHLGVLQVLTEANIPVDVVAGVSAGSVVGALYCAGVSLSAMIEALKHFTWWNIAGPTWPQHGFLSFAKLETYLNKFIGDISFDQLKKPFAVVTTDLLTGCPVTFTAGPVARLVRASCSIPGLVVPLNYGPYWLVDGGASCNLPSHAARELGADVVIGVDLVKPYVRRSFGPLGIASTALEILVRHSGGGIEAADVLISPALDNKSYSRFSRHVEMMELGEAAARAVLPVIRTLLEEEMPVAAGRS
jgi:NTE family protein